ncbi:right-handed parallel beta-helix repeat-containing protein [Kitasatospora sp. NPDC059571]|uniref:right-handed parallel beta-helix repeat-containing protein n=1 Tax=Kitasatospora sp. NPDC059571 TaxID=3346871 RepID=UPI00367CE5F5
MRQAGAARAAILVLLAGGMAPLATPASADTAPAPAAGLLRVDGASSTCSDGTAGVDHGVFCTISAAAAVVEPGQTVVVEPGIYNEAVHITRSGTDAAPITFRADHVWSRGVRVGAVSATLRTPAFELTGVQHVTVQGFDVQGGSYAPSLLVTDSSDVVVQQGSVQGSVRQPGVRVTGSSARVSIRRVEIVGGAPAVQIDGGAAATTVSGNSIWGDGTPYTTLRATDAPGTVVTGNTVLALCSAGVVLDGASPNAVVENNIIETAGGSPDKPTGCTKATAAPAVTVSAGSATGTTVDYNLADPTSGLPLYDWSGTAYDGPAALLAATGQGRHDLAADPKLYGSASGEWFGILSGSPAEDSANADAPGALDTDFLGRPRLDDPAVANTGAGAHTFADRGATELQDSVSSGNTTVDPAPGGGPLDVVVTATPGRHTWTSAGPDDREFVLTFDGDPYPVTITGGKVTHTFRRAGRHSIGVFVTADGYHASTGSRWSMTTMVGAAYTPVTPVRLLDTRSGVGVKGTAPVAPGADVVLPLPAIDGVPIADVSALVANVTVTEPTAAGYLTVYPDNSGLPTASNLNFTAGKTVPNLVTVPAGTAGLRLHNGSPGTVHVLLDLAGYYSNRGSGFAPLTPVRVLDTRSGLGTSAARPVAAGGDLRLDLSGRIPAGATAVVLNTTVTGPTAPGYLSVFPAGAPRPTASNLNFTAGQTVPNLVIAPVVNGRVDLHNGSAGTTHVIADLAGYFGDAASGADQVFVPRGPERLVDTRTGQGDPNRKPGLAVAAFGTYGSVVGAFDYDFAGAPLPASLVVNVTVTQTSGTGFLTAYPNTAGRPTASNLNFTAGQTVANLVTVPVKSSGASFYNGSPGSLQLIVDQEGYYIERSA